jgi:hypothetical protein
MNANHIQELKRTLRPELSARQERLIAELLTQPTLRKAAANAGVPEQTARRWLSSNAAFRARFCKASRAPVEAAIKARTIAAYASVQALRRTAEDERAPARKRLAACSSLLHLSLRGMELNLAERLATLERETRQMTERLRAGAGRPE